MLISKLVVQTCRPRKIDPKLVFRQTRTGPGERMGLKLEHAGLTIVIYEG